MNALIRKMSLRKLLPKFFSVSYLDFNKVDVFQVQNFLNQNKIPFKYKEYCGQIVLKFCPLCDKPHKNQVSNMWTLNIKGSNGVFMCFRCGKYGSWNDFVRQLIGEEQRTNDLNQSKMGLSPEQE